MTAEPANIIPPGVTVFCDPTLGPAMRALGRLSRSQVGAPVSVLSAPASAMLAQIQRHTRNDVLFTLSSAMDVAEQKQLLRPGSRKNGFSNRLVLAGLSNRRTAPADKDAVLDMIAKVTIAVTDNTVASGLDGRAVLDANGLTKAAGNRVMGAANTLDVAFLIVTGAVDIGLLYATDVKSDPRLMVLATLNADPVLTSYTSAVNAKAVSPNAQAFLNVMQTAMGSASLRAAGLEVVV